MNLNMYNNITVNKSLMKLVGCTASIYWSVLMEILPRVLDKKTYNEDGYFPVHRNYIEKQVGLSLEDQYNCDSILNNIGVLEYNLSDRNQIRVNPQKMNEIIIDESAENVSKVILDAQLSREVKKINKELAAKYTKDVKAAAKAVEKEEKAAKEQTKDDAKIKMFKNYVALIETNDKLVPLYQDWIESAYNRYGWLSKAIISTFRNELNAYTDNEISKLAVLRAAIRLGYKEFMYIRNAYEKQSNQAVLAGVPVTPQPKANINMSDMKVIEFN